MRISPVPTSRRPTCGTSAAAQPFVASTGRSTWSKPSSTSEPGSTIMRYVPTACAALFSTGLALIHSAGEPVVYATIEKDNTIAVVSTRTDSVVATIPVGRRPRGMALSPDGRTVYVALGENNAIGVVDVAGRTMVKAIPAGTDPELVEVSPDGKVLYV